MKKLFLYLFLVSSLVSSTQYTGTIGVTNIILPAGTTTSASYTFLSTAYNQDPVYSGAVDAINGASLTLADFSLANYEDNELTQSAHLLRVVDGNADGNADLNSTVNGMVFPVIGHVGDVVTINATPTEVSTYLALYDGVEIIKQIQILVWHGR